MIGIIGSGVGAGAGSRVYGTRYRANIAIPPCKSHAADVGANRGIEKAGEGNASPAFSVGAFPRRGQCLSSEKISSLMRSFWRFRS